MGIKNRKNALYMATGIDNSGLKEDAEDGKRIIRDMTGAAVSEGKKMNEALGNTSGIKLNAQQTKALIASLTQDLSRMNAFMEKSRNAGGVVSPSDLIFVDKLKEKIEELEMSLVELDKQKTKSADKPIIPKSFVVDAERVQKTANNLSFSVQQVARELPSLAMGPQMFFLAISNNLPILADNIKVAKQEYKALTDAQQKATPVWKQVLSSMISWQTAMVVGITLLVVYGKDLVEWIKTWGKSKEAIDANTVALKNLSAARLKGTLSAQKELTHLRLLYKATQDETISKRDKLKVIKELQDKYPSYFGNLSREEILAGNAASAYYKLSKAIIESAKARAIEDKIVENEKANLEDRGKLAMAIAKLQNTQRYTKTTAIVDGKKGKIVETGAYLDAKNEVKRIKDLMDARKKSNESLAKEIKNPTSLLDVDQKDTGAVKDIQSLADRIADAQVKAQQKIDSLRLAAMIDGAAKRKEEAKVQLKEELDRINKEERDRLQALAAAQKAGVKVTPKEINAVTDQSSTQRNIATANYDQTISNIDTDVAKKQADELTELTDKYQSYTDKRIKIENKFNEDIQKLIEARNAAQTSGDDTQVEALNRNISQATADKGKSLMSLDFGQLKESPDYVKGFENLKQTSTETLNSLLSQFEKAKQTAAETLNPEQLREYTSIIESIMDELESRNPFEMLVQRKQELAEAENELAEAQKNLDDVKGGKQVVSGTHHNQKTGKIDKSYLTEEKAMNKLNKAKDKVVKKNAQVDESEKKVTEQIGDLSTSLSDVGSAIGGTAGEIISLVGDIGNFAASAMDGIKTVSDTTAQSVGAIEKASVILAIISTAIQLATKVAQLISGKSKEQEDTEKLKGVTDKISQVQDTINTLIEKRIDLIKEATSAEKNYLASLTQTSIDVQKKYYEQQFESLLGNDFLAKKGKNNNLSLSELGITSIDELKQFMGSDSLLGYLNNNYGIRDMDDWQQLIDAWDDLSDKEEEVSSALAESSTGLSFDDAKDALDDLLLSADTTEQNIADNFEGYMKNAILNVVKTNYMTDALKGWYENFTKAMDDGVLSDDEVKKLREEYSSIYDTAQEQINAMLDTVGIDKSSDGEDGVSGKLQDALTEGTANEVLGVMNMGTLDIRAIKAMLPSHFANYATTMNNISSILDQTRQISANTFRTANNTDGLVEKLETGLNEVKTELVEIRKNTKDNSGR